MPNQNENCYSEPESEALSGFCLEEDLLESLGIKKSALGDLRQHKDFPFVKIQKNVRIYYLPDVREWLLTKRWNVKE
jgi:hypothetical protein